MRKIKYKVPNKKSYVTGGMYGSNTLPQGIAPGSTSNTVFNENSSEKQDVREESLNAEIEKQKESSAAMSTEMANKKIEDNQTLQANSAALKTKFSTAEQTVSKGITTFTDAAAKLQKPGDLNWAGRVAKRGNIAKEAGNMQKAGRLAKRSAKLGEWSNKAGQAAKWGTATTKAGKMLRNPNVIGTAATVVGEGLNYAFDDKDATKWNAGEVAGGTVAGIGAGIGAAASAAAIAGTSLGPIGTAVGAVGGAIYGVGKGLVQRKKARKEKAVMEGERRAAVGKHNTGLKESLTSQMSQSRAGEMQQKTYSGYDLGRNLTARYGGVKKYI